MLFLMKNSMEVEGNVKQINHLLELQNFLYIKKIAVSILTFIRNYFFGQTVNNYKAVIVCKYEWLKIENQ
jgi:hypothetical protein